MDFRTVTGGREEGGGGCGGGCVCQLTGLGVFQDNEASGGLALHGHEAGCWSLEADELLLVREHPGGVGHLEASWLGGRRRFLLTLCLGCILCLVIRVHCLTLICSIKEPRLRLAWPECSLLSSDCAMRTPLPSKSVTVASPPSAQVKGPVLA